MSSPEASYHTSKRLYSQDGEAEGIGAAVEAFTEPEVLYGIKAKRKMGIADPGRALKMPARRHRHGDNLLIYSERMS